jgi:hypothetical protein
VPGDEFCVTADGKCSLRAALEESNSSAEASDAIFFEEEPFEADDPPITLVSELPVVTDQVSIVGRECETGAGVVGPCVEIDGLDSAPALTVAKVAVTEGFVDIESLAITDSEVGIEAEEVDFLRIRNNWFGIGVDGGAAANEIGIRLGPGSEEAQIGGEGPGTGNLFAHSTIGLDLLGASKVKVVGNRFGVAPTGTEAAANGTDIAIASTKTSAAIGNTVGTRVSPEAAATAQCDGGCNLISGSGSSGIDLDSGGERLPAVGTTVAGNHIGLDATGEASIPNAGAGVFVGSASHTVIGGPRAGDTNRIVDGSAAVEAGPEASNLIVRGNLIGSRATASETADPPEDGLLIDSTGLSLPTQEAVILENEIGLAGGIGISQAGLGSEISGNLIAGAATGIEVQEEGFENLIESNVVKAANVGLLVKGRFNAIVGNAIVGGQKTGIRIEGSGLFGVSGNVIGGDTATAENTIDGSTEDAIEIVNPRESRNEIARNRGSGNGGLFIDLIASPPDPSDLEPGDPNGGILPPTIATISGTGAAGFAEPGAMVRVFRKGTPSPGEIESFLGQATADEKGNWSLSFPALLPPGTALAATQTLDFGTSELAFAAAPQPGEGQPTLPPSADSLADRKPPRTRLLGQPRRVREGRAARFKFTSNEPGAHFQCSLDGSKFRACVSPKKYRGLQPGKHVFRVRAIDAAGNADPTPLRRRFEVLD